MYNLKLTLHGQSVTIGTHQVRLTNDMASTYGSELFHGLTRTNINMKNHITLVDTGAGRSAIALEAYDQGTHGPISRNEWKPKLRQICGGKMRIVGSITVNWSMGDITIKHTIWVVKGMAFEVVMGRDALRTMSAVIDCGK
jgi:hypothetical protein